MKPGTLQLLKEARESVECPKLAKALIYAAIMSNGKDLLPQALRFGIARMGATWKARAIAALESEGIPTLQRKRNPPTMERRNNIYYSPKGFMLPRDKDGTVRNKLFVECSFHPESGPFVNCKFIRCRLPKSNQIRNGCVLEDCHPKHRR